MSKINEIWKQELYERTIKTWGEKSQFEMAQEEATELALAVRKFIRKGNDKTFQDLAGEIADVEIMIEQMKLMEKSLPMVIDEIKFQKLERLEKRINFIQFEDVNTD